jgi:Arc/MetJ-type ribon-helix-helix transcriptional regulator
VPGPGFTPVMARLGADDLETLDTLISAGIATSRAEAVRWALARLRERPAYEQLRARTREIDELKSQF